MLGTPGTVIRGLTALALAAGAVAVAVARWVFPFGSVDNDEGIYRLQAQTLSHGHLFPPAPHHPGSFSPWLAATVGHHYVLKYTPGEAALLAVSHLVTGSYLPLLAGVAGGVVVATWLLACAVLENEGEALAAAALVATSPLVVVQSGLLLAYLPTLLVLELFAWCLIGAVHAHPGGRTKDRRAAAAGVLLGVAVAVRPYDAVLFASPVLVWAIVAASRSGSRSRDWSRLVGSLAGGGALPALCLAGYDLMATGRALTLPFNLLERADGLGFGVHRMFPGDEAHHFGVLEGLAGAGDHLRLLIMWVAGGPFLVVIAVIAARRMRGSGRAVAAIALTLPAGYVFFWGAWNAADLWGGLGLVGPFYVLPVVVPLAILGARSLALLQYRPWLLGATIGAMVTVTAVTATPAVAAAARASRQDGQLLRLSRTPAGSTVVFVVSRPGFVGHPISGLANGWRVGDGRGAVYAVASNTGADLDALADVPGRPIYLLTLSGGYSPHPPHPGGRLQRMGVLAGDTVTLEIASPPGARVDALIIGAGRWELRCGLASPLRRWRVQVSASGAVACEGTAASLTAGSVAPGTRGSLTLAAWGPQGRIGTVRLPVSRGDGTVSILVPGETVATAGRPPASPGLTVAGRSLVAH